MVDIIKKKLIALGLRKNHLWWAAAYVVLKWLIVLTLGAYLIKKGLWKNHYVWYISLIILPGIIYFFVKRRRNKK
ncbi:MAG: hypothetical protein H6607_08195 [Flavobacteriales bacterium]|nr:hypothetical protein [Flavobacteriales bacterium]